MTDAPATPPIQAPADLYDPLPARVDPPAAEAAPEPAPEPEAPPVLEQDPAKPEAMKFNLPDGFQADPATLTQLTDILNTKDLSPQELGQKLVDLYVAEQTKAAGSQGDNWNQMQQDWQKQIEQDSVMGGSNMPKTLETLGKALDTYGSKEAREAFELTGAGNNPHIVRMIYQMASALNEGSYVSPKGPAQTDWRGKSRGEVLYGNPPQQSN